MEKETSIDSLCGKEDCKHLDVYYCDCCEGIHCEDCDVKWVSPTLYDWGIDSGGNYVASERSNDHCMKPGEGDCGTKCN